MADLVDRLIEAVSQLAMRIGSLEGRLDTMIRHGKVTDVDTKKQLARIEIGERDGTPVKSAWVPYAQLAGDYKSHRPPTKGQQMTLFAPNGEVRQAMLLPFTWSDQNKSPSDKDDEHVTTFGKLKIVEKGESYDVGIGDAVKLTLTKDRATMKAGTIVLDGEVLLGGEGASRQLALQGSIDSAGDVETGNLSAKVKAI